MQILSHLQLPEVRVEGGCGELRAAADADLVRAHVHAGLLPEQRHRPAHLAKNISMNKKYFKWYSSGWLTWRKEAQLWSRLISCSLSTKFAT